MVRQNALPKVKLITASGFRNRFREVYDSAIAENSIIITGAFGQSTSALILLEPDNQRKLEEVLERLHGPSWTIPEHVYTLRYLRNNFAEVQWEIAQEESSAIIQSRIQPHRHAYLETVGVLTYIDPDDLNGVNNLLEKFRGYSPTVKRRKAS